MMKSVKALLLAISLIGSFLQSGCAQLANSGSLLSATAAKQHGEQVSVGSRTMQSSEEIVVSYLPATLKLTLHEPVILDFTVQNNLVQRVKLDLGQDRKESFRFTVVQPDGTSVQLPRWHREGISRIGRLSLDSQQTYSQRLLLNECLDFSTPGKYEVKVHLATAIKNQEGQVLAANTSGRVTLEIEPRDVEHLKKVSAALLDRIIEASSYEQASEAALALSYIEDPVAIGDLEKALTSGRIVEPIAIAGLERIGNDEAVQSLISALRDQNTETAQLARSALVHIEQKSSDPTLKEKIRRAL